MKMRTSHIVGYVAIIVLAYVALNYQTVVDDYALATFHPTGEVATLTTQLDLTPKAKAIWYGSRPQVDNKTAFNADCQPGQGELELGCYYRGRIYILEITNPALAPEMEVVAAHELLHAVYARLSMSQKSPVNTEVEQAYAGINNADLTARMADYAQSEPGEQDNELHSILGSEFASLPTALVAHYALYFRDRAAITSAEAAYTAVFTAQKAKIDTELATIDRLKSDLQVLDNTMNRDRSNGDISEYNALVPQQNALVNEVNNDIAAYQADVNEYNELSVGLNSQQITPSDVQPVQ